MIQGAKNTNPDEESDMESFAIYCTGCCKVIGEAYAKEDSGVAKGDIKDAYYCADCAEADES